MTDPLMVEMIRQEVERIFAERGFDPSLRQEQDGGDEFLKQQMQEEIDFLMEEFGGLQDPELELVPEPMIPSKNMDGFQIYTATHAVFYVSMDDAMDGYDPSPIAAGGAGHEHWSIELVVSGSTFTGVWEGTEVLDDGSTAAHLWDGNAAADPVEAQKFYRLNIIRGGKRVCGGGSYRENIFCAGSYGPIVELVRI